MGKSIVPLDGEFMVEKARKWESRVFQRVCEPIRASGSVYSSDPARDGEKYVFFSLAALELPRQLGWNVDVLHANDWHTALAAYGNLVRRWNEGTRRAASVITVHNLRFMGPDVS